MEGKKKKARSNFASRISAFNAIQGATPLLSPPLYFPLAMHTSYYIAASLRIEDQKNNPPKPSLSHQYRLTFI